MVRTLKENKIRMILAAALLTVLFTFSSYAKDYVIYDCWWEETEDSISAAWEKAEDPTKYRVRLFREDLPKGLSSVTSMDRKDMTDLLLKYGPGKYRFEVYPIKGGEELLAVSDAYDFDVEHYAQIRHKKNRAKTASTPRISESTKQEDGTSPLRLSSPDGICLNEDGQLKWNAVENACGYLVRFYRNGEIIGVQRTDKHRMDILEYLDECTEIRLSAFGESGKREIISSKPAVFDVQPI